jgi:hypothetical protein
MGQERATWLRQSSGTQANPNPTDPAARAFLHSPSAGHRPTAVGGPIDNQAHRD